MNFQEKKKRLTIKGQGDGLTLKNGETTAVYFFSLRQE